MKIHLVTTALSLTVWLSPSDSAARPDDVSIGAITFASLGAAGALVSGFGNFVHISRREHSGLWGWLCLASGLSLTGGAIVLADREPTAETISSIAISLGVFSVVTGVVGLALPTPEATERWRRDWPVVPTVSAASGSTTYGIAGAY